MGKLLELIAYQVTKHEQHKEKRHNELLIAEDENDNKWVIIEGCAAFRVRGPWIFDTEKLIANIGQYNVCKSINSLIKGYEGEEVTYYGTTVNDGKEVAVFRELDVDRKYVMNMQYWKLLQKLFKELPFEGRLYYSTSKCMFLWEVNDEPNGFILGIRGVIK